MSNLGVFVNRQTLSNAEQLSALLKCRDAAEDMGHTVDFIFPEEIKRLLKMDGLFIRTNTDPMNVAFVASKMASLHNIPVVDDPASIQICADKVNMYYHLIKNNVKIPKTAFLKKKDITIDHAKVMFDNWGTPLILKEPSTCFSARVEKARDPGRFHEDGEPFHETLRLDSGAAVRLQPIRLEDWCTGWRTALRVQVYDSAGNVQDTGRSERASGLLHDGKRSNGEDPATGARGRSEGCQGDW